MPITKKEVSKTISLKSKLRNIEDKKSALEEVGEYLRDSILDSLGDAETPVQGGSYKATLSDPYKKIKAKISGSKDANLELFGDMLDALDYNINPRKGTVTVGIFDDEQAEKAYGHNTGFKGHPNPKMRGNKNKRQFIPNSKQKFKEEIMNGIDRILKDYASES